MDLFVSADSVEQVCEFLNFVDLASRQNMFFQIFVQNTYPTRDCSHACTPTHGSLKNHLYRESEDYQRPIPPENQDRQRRGRKFSETYHQGSQIDPKTEWKFWRSSSSSSPWWQSDNWMNGTIMTLNVLRKNLGKMQTNFLYPKVMVKH